MAACPDPGKGKDHMTVPAGEPAPNPTPAPAASPAPPPAASPAASPQQPPALVPSAAPAQPTTPPGGAQPAAPQPTPAASQLSDAHAQALLADAISRANANNTAGVNEHGYPDNTPVTAMAPEQQVAYWRHHARKHEERVKAMGDYEQLQVKARELDALVEASKTEHEKAVDAARKQAREAALAEVGGQLVDAHIRVAAAGRADEATVAALLGPLDKRVFLTADGSVDADKVASFVNAVLPANPASAPAAGAGPAQAPAAPAPAAAAAAAPDMGQGRRDSTTPSGLAAGAAVARARFGLDKHPTPGQ